MKKTNLFLLLFFMLAVPCQAQMKLAVLEPEGAGLSNDEQWMLSLAQSSIAADFNKYSHITIIDRQNLEAVMAEWKHSLSGITSEEDAIKIGNLANANHILTGKITKTPNAFMLELAVTDVKTGERKASHSPQAVTPSSLEDLSALKEASADLLKQLGVSLTESQLAELNGPVASAQVQAQTALAHGIVAERQGTSVAALSYYYQAAAFDPTLAEAVKRSSVMSANISGINLGDNIRNDIVWRKKWIEQLKETEETFYRIINNAPLPYELCYSTVIETGKIDYQKETADLSISLNLLANAEWFVALQRSLKAAQAVQDGLNATGRKKDWGLDEWPKRGVSETNPFVENEYGVGYKKKSKNYDIPIEFELVNQKGRVIGENTIRLNPSISINENFVVKFKPNQSSILTFNAVNANDISDNLTIRLVSVNGKSTKTAGFPIIAVSNKEFPEYRVQTKRTTFTDSRDGRKYKAVEIGPQIWMAENLNFNAKGSVCFDNKPANCQKYGRLYNWNTAITACPKDWHLPSRDEWDILELSAGDDKAGKYLKATSGWKDNGNGTDSYGFSALPGGNGSLNRNFLNVVYNFSFVGNYGIWWSASENGSKNAYYRSIDYRYERVIYDNYEKDNSFSVRCVKD
ncbi:MAG: hypothetical protein LBC75_03380 [Fibromonadaceae bacterium]|jgi:uncharacterized protein (TIGR02145 family)|nr:hypothetical protein [Fibromonadaceae bacterium]